MPCNWSTTASSLLRSFRFNAFTNPRASLHSVQSHLLATPGHGNIQLGSHFSARTFASPALAPHPPITSNPLSSALVSATVQLSAAQVSRATAQAVRLCIREGGFGDALYVVNSACHSVLGGPLQASQTSSPAGPNLEPLSFGRPVSPRLASHAFLHGLIRGGYSSKAKTYAALMMQVGIPIRPRTLELIISSMIPPRSAHRKLGPFVRVIPRKHHTDSTILQLRTGMVSDECAHAALELLQQARTFGQHRTERMYRVMFETLLMQGEIIVASLLFVLLLKDWELRKAQEKVLQETASEEWVSHDHIGVPRPSLAALIGSPYPDLKVMGSIVQSIDTAFSRLPDSESAFLPYLQSLAIFAMLLDTGQLHTHRVASIISTLSRCPKTDARVWIWQGGQPVLVKAYSYFHDVLKRLIQSLSRSSPEPAPNLSRRGYNSLLSYALRHQLSPKMASQVLHHMCVERTNPIPPDIVTYNILLRSGSLLRQMYISDMALAALRAGSKQLGTETPALDDLKPSASVAVEESDGYSGDIPHSSIPTALARLDTETLVLPRAVASPIKPSKPDKYTLSSIVKYFTFTGRPDAVATALFDMLPELHIIDHPATNGTTTTLRQIRLSRQDALKRAVRHGPYVYSAIIDALVKAGEIGLAERVFILAQQAQQASLIPGFVKDVAPWSLSVHAYTSMMQCYAAVAHGGFSKDRLSGHRMGSALLAQQSHWVPKAHHHRQGYAAYVYGLSLLDRDHVKGYTKHQTSRRNGSLLLRSMMSGGRALWVSLVLDPNVHPLWKTTAARRGAAPPHFPKPDARFFKAALDLFVGPVYTRPTARRRRGRGATSRGWSPMLQKLAGAMVAHGYDIPEEYRPLLAGRWTGPMTTNRQRKAAVLSPYAFPQPSRRIKTWKQLTTVKTKGLPIRASVGTRRVRGNSHRAKRRILEISP